MSQAPLVFSETQAAEMLGVSPRTLQRWRVTGEGPQYTKLGKRVGYTEQALRKLIEESQRTSTSESAA